MKREIEILPFLFAIQNQGHSQTLQVPISRLYYLLNGFLSYSETKLRISSKLSSELCSFLLEIERMCV